MFPMVFLKPMEPAVARLSNRCRRNEGQTVQIGSGIGISDPGVPHPANPVVQSAASDERLSGGRSVGVRLARRHRRDARRSISLARRADADGRAGHRRAADRRRVTAPSVGPRRGELWCRDGGQLRPVRHAGARAGRHSHGRCCRHRSSSATRSIAANTTRSRCSRSAA